MEKKQEKSTANETSLLYSFSLLKKLLRFVKVAPGSFTYLYIILGIIALIQLPAPFLFKSIIDNVLPNNNTNLLLVIIISLIVIEILKNIFAVINTFLLAKISQKLAADLRKKVFGHYLELPFQHFLETPTGKMVNRLVSDTDATSKFIQNMLWVVPLPIVMVLIGSGVIMIWNWKIGLYILLTIPLTIFLTKRLSKKLKTIRVDLRTAQENLQGKTNEMIDNIRAIRAFNREPEFDSELALSIDNVKSIGISHFLNSSMLRSTNKMIEVGSSYLFIIFGAYLTITKEISLGEFFAFKYFQEMIAPNLNQLFNYTTELPNHMVSIERVFEVLDMPTEPNRNTGEYCDHITGEIKFEDASLTYPDGTKALKHINLHIQPNEVIAIIGPSGSGKTSLVSLLLGLYPITEGKIKIGQQSLADLNITSYRRRIGAIFQEAQLFDSSIEENLKVGCSQIPTEDKIWEALEFANAAEFVRECKDGLKTVIGSKGIKLSGGQRQRLTIARVFLKNPDVLIFDEATSALDSISEKEIQNQMKNISKGRTTILIAHRLSTIAIADRVVVMDKGEIKEVGKHRDLLAQGGLYKQLYSAQMDGFLKWEEL
jgi:subfamily B ATP-binding cassette protein MsbA